MKQSRNLNQSCHPEHSEGSLMDSSHALKMTAESGRSMVEMLGVLAVVGILSVIGIVGFNTLMTKHKTNEILRSMAIANQQLQLGNNPEYLPVEGVQFQTRQLDGQPAYLTVTVEEQAVCQQLKAMAEGSGWIVEGSCSENS